MRRKRRNPTPPTTSRPETAPAASYSADWPDPDYPGSTRGMHVGASGVTVWSRSGLNPHTESGAFYTWEELRKRDKAALHEAAPHEADHDTPEALEMSRDEVDRIRSRMLGHAASLWELIRPGVAFKPAEPQITTKGTVTTTRTAFVDEQGKDCFHLIDAVDRWSRDGTPWVRYRLRIETEWRRRAVAFKLWHHEGVLQVQVKLQREERVRAFAQALEVANPSLFKDQSLRGRVFANPHGSSTSSRFGSGPPIVA